MKKLVATFAMGCFWSPDLLFSKIPGVKETEVGYTGGNEEKFPNPTYDQVCSGKTGYVEAVKIVFDPKKISYEQLLEIFWKNHNSTTPNRQGADVGTQYRSAIFYHDEEQKEKALMSKLEHQNEVSKKIVTEILPAKLFFKAEDYHQKYLEKRGKDSCEI